MIAELDRSEMVARVSLAAALGLPIQLPTRGLLISLVIAVVIVIVGQIIAKLTFRNHKFEKALQGKNAVLVGDGAVDLDQMKKVQMTPERLWAALRKKGIRQLGEVKRFYFEDNGEFSLIKSDDPKPGLSVLPYWDKEIRQRQKETDQKVCTECGTQRDAETVKCRCGNDKTERAVI